MADDVKYSGGKLQLDDGTQIPAAAVKDDGTYAPIGDETLFVKAVTTKATAATDVLASKVTADAANRFVVNTDGSMEWGDGTSAADVLLARSAALTALLTGKLKVSGAFACNGVTPPAQPTAPTKPITTAATQTTPFGFATQAQADAIVTALNLVIDILHNNGMTT